MTAVTAAPTSNVAIWLTSWAMQFIHAARQYSELVFCFQARSQNCEERLLASSCPSVRPSAGTTCHPLDGCLWNLIFEYFSKICRENSRFIKFCKDDWYISEDQCTFMITSRPVLLRIRNVSVRSCTEYQNTFYGEYFYFWKPFPLWDNVNKFCRAREATDRNTAHALCVLDT